MNKINQIEGNGVILCDPKNKPVQSTSEMRLRIQTLSAMKFPILNGSTAIMHLHSTEVPIVVVKIEKLVASFAAEGAAKDDDNKKPPRFVKRWVFVFLKKELMQI